MVYKVIVRDLAKEDTQAAYDHYEDERQGLGEEFLEELLKKFDDLTSKPHNYGYIDDQAIILNVKIDRFPYVIVFEIIEDNVVVYSVHGTSRHPKRRLRKI
ncbi:type II toxin-antitoxin system RelE/ParE family toxin [Flavitalea sp. BT771]|uniref:type II toxin-antitoxin system RelE/ParE family toxin n=1 Tax=Flavitalea sp. BT771 TaxID=3063329 RepID=UPI0026E34842|nr:type II toxin-antitoxin system RelE/ParE family toxin [Flavitalea sp. BT771]MDO6430113.1 type II toxin-antitoxin system RelE/ParE family toxin [Flavitalea sp. BT771]MDV6219748.1 type II toxin-antitoxin system RelE/ParE family toxin [Flavitalea sp. BT771]